LPTAVPKRPTPTAEAAAVARSNGGGRVRLASGNEAEKRATATSAASPRLPRTAAGMRRTCGTPRLEAVPARSATSAASIDGAMNGAARRFASGETSDSRPKCHRIRGSVAACAASDTDADSTSQPGVRPGARPPTSF
jgi:hypothetical protein